MGLPASRPGPKWTSSEVLSAFAWTDFMETLSQGASLQIDFLAASMTTLT